MATIGVTMQARKAQRSVRAAPRCVFFTALLLGLASAPADAEQTAEQKAALEAAKANVYDVYWTLETDPPILRNIYAWSEILFTVIYEQPERRARVDAAITEIITAGGRPASEYDGMPTRYTAFWYVTPDGRELVPPPRISALVLREIYPLIEFEDYGLHYCFYFVEGRFGQWPFDPIATLMGMYRRRSGDPLAAAIVAAGLPVRPPQHVIARSGPGDTYEDVRRALRRISGLGGFSMGTDMKIISYDLRRHAETGFVLDTFHIVGTAYEIGPGPGQYPCLERYTSTKQKMMPIRAANLGPTDGIIVQFE